jgi:hypothetical protein
VLLAVAESVLVSASLELALYPVVWLSGSHLLDRLESADRLDHRLPVGSAFQTISPPDTDVSWELCFSGVVPSLVPISSLDVTIPDLQAVPLPSSPFCVTILWASSEVNTSSRFSGPRLPERPIRSVYYNWSSVDSSTNGCSR